MEFIFRNIPNYPIYCSTLYHNEISKSMFFFASLPKDSVKILDLLCKFYKNRAVSPPLSVPEPVHYVNFIKIRNFMNHCTFFHFS